MSNLETLKEWLQKGMRFVTFSSDVDMLAKGAAESLVQLKRAI
jgi:2-keto-3-deoxy-L-rhamnonate aldolase RhmA